MKKFDANQAMRFLKMICDASDFLGRFFSRFSDKARLEFYLKNSRNRLRIFSHEIMEYLGRDVGSGVFVLDFESYPFEGLRVKPCNCLAVKEGRTIEEIWICGHHDYCAALGAEDNAAALAIMIELARCLKDEKLNYTLCFASFDLEEYSQVGAVNTVSSLKNGRFR